MRRVGYYVESTAKWQDEPRVAIARLEPIRRRVVTYRSDYSDRRVTIGRDEQSNLCLDVTIGHRTINVALTPRLHRCTPVRFVRDLLDD